MSWLDNVVIGPPGPAGPAGPTGPAGATGEAAYTITTASFVQPSVLGSATIDVASSLWMAADAYLFIDTGGTYQVISITSSTQIVAMLVDAIAAPASTVAGGVLVSPSGVPGGGGGVVRPYPTDASDLHVWKLDEAYGTPAFYNSGTSSLILSPTGTLRAGSAGIYSAAASLFPSAAAYLASVNNIDYPGTGNVTASIWVYHVSSSNSCMFARFARPSPNWTSPYVAWMLSRNGGATNFAICVAGTYHTMAASYAPDLVTNAWNHVGLSYDGTTLRGYVNGNLVNDAAIAGAVDYTGAAPYAIGSDRAVIFDSVRGVYADARVASVARSESWFAEVYQRGLYGV